MKKLLIKLKDILEEYADDNNYSASVRSCSIVTNGHSEETFYEFFGDSDGAKEGIELINQKLKEIELKE